MKKRTEAITVCAMMTALSVIFMYLGTLIPTGKLAFMAIAALFVIVAVIHCGKLFGLITYIAAAIIGFLILPDKSSFFYFVMFFGYYPMLKSVFEKFGKVWLIWIAKLAVFNAALTVLFVFMKELLLFSFMDKLSGTVLSIVIYAVFNAAFIVYDIGLSKAITFYMTSVYKKIKR